MSLQDPPPRRRWPRSQRFTLSAQGLAAEESYQSSIVASRLAEGRASFDSARASWAAALHLESEDGLYLSEVKEGPKTMQQIVEGLETCGKTKKEAIAALERLVDAGLVSAPPPPVAPAQGGARW